MRGLAGELDVHHICIALLGILGKNWGECDIIELLDTSGKRCPSHCGKYCPQSVFIEMQCLGRTGKARCVSCRACLCPSILSTGGIVLYLRRRANRINLGPTISSAERKCRIGEPYGIPNRNLARRAVAKSYSHGLVREQTVTCIKSAGLPEDTIKHQASPIDHSIGSRKCW